MPATYDWLIIGAGPQGRFIGSALAAADADLSIALIDPEAPMQAWQRRAAATGMTFLRSSNAHHLGRHRRSLHDFMQAGGYDARDTLGYYKRPSLRLFNALAEAELARLAHIRQRAERLTRDGAYWQVTLADGRRVAAAHVVIASGPGEAYRPEGLAACEHVFDDGFELGRPGRATIIVGGGITGAQLALRARAEGHRVAWLTRREPEPGDFDSEPRYAGPLGMRPFLAASFAERTTLLAAARRPGTLPPDIYSQITAALAAGEIDWIQATPVAYRNGDLQLADGRVLDAPRVILATGFAPEPAPTSLLGRALAEAGGTTDGHGHIVIDSDLQLAPGLHIAGRPASLQLGPMAGNIKGARWAGERLAAVARAERDTKKPA